MQISGLSYFDLTSLVAGVFASGEFFTISLSRGLSFAFSFTQYHCYSKNLTAEADLHELERLRKESSEIKNQLEHLEKLSSLGVMAAGMAHELNNPLTVIKGNIDIFSVMPLDRIRERLPTIKSQADRMVEIVDHLRNFTRKETKLDWKLQHISKSIKNAILLHRHNIRNKRIDLRVEIDEEAYIYGGEHQLESVWQNLIGNSCDAFNENPKSSKVNRISINVNLSGDRISLVYRDNAGGMTQETLEKLFDPFYTTKAVGKGTGLGMAIAYGIIHEHKGTIAVDSVNGQGTVFTVELPRRTMEIKNQPMPSDESEQELYSLSETKLAKDTSFTGSKKILVVDDEQGILEFLNIALGEAYEVETALSGSEALEKLSKEKYIGMIADINMPVMKGDELAKVAKEKYPDLHVVFMSAHALDVIESEMGIYLGASKLIPKPFKSPSDVLKKVISYFEEEHSQEDKAS